MCKSPLSVPPVATSSKMAASRSPAPAANCYKAIRYAVRISARSNSLALMALLLSNVQEMACQAQPFRHLSRFFNQIEPGLSLLRRKLKQILFVPLCERFDTYQRYFLKIGEIGAKLRAGGHVD